MERVGESAGAMICLLQQPEHRAQGWHTPDVHVCVNIMYAHLLRLGLITEKGAGANPKIRHGFSGSSRDKTFGIFICLNYADPLSGLPLAQVDMRCQTAAMAFSSILKGICFFTFKCNGLPKGNIPFARS